MDVKTIIANAKQKKFLAEGETSTRQFLASAVRELTEKTLADITPKIVAEARNVIENEILKMTQVVKKGDTGEKGESIVGPSGRDGVDGTSIPGRDGRDADEEKIIESVLGQIPKPQDGKDGSPDTAEQIAKKLNTLTEAVDFGVIRGLKTWMTNMQRSMKEKHGSGGKAGGGMGNWLHESFAINSTTTSITTSAHIAANGFAVFAFYQGGMIARGSTWSVTGRNKINLLFSPQDNTNIDVIYVRA